MTADFALAPALRARLLGVGLVALGVLVLVGAGATWLLDAPRWVLGLVAVVVLLGVLTLGLLVGVRRWVLRLDETGYRVRVLRTAEARSARWTDVLDLQAATVAGQRCLVLRLRDGRTTAIPVDAVEGDPAALSEAITQRLDRGHGYRRVS